MGPETEVKKNTAAPAVDNGTVLPPAAHRITFRDRNDAEGVAQIYYKDCKTTDLKTGKELSVAELAKKLEKDTNMANSRYNASHKGAEILKSPFDRAAFEKKWIKDHIGDVQLTHDGETKSAVDFVKSARDFVNSKSAVESPLMLDATVLHFKDNRKVSEASLKSFVEKHVTLSADGQNRLNGDIKVDDERRGTVHAGILHLKGRSGVGLPGGSITLSTDDRKWGLESDHVLKTKEVKHKK